MSGDYAPVTSIVPHGSVLGLYLVDVFFVDFETHTNRSKLIKFADDATIVLPLNKCDSNSSAQELISSEMSSATSWCHHNNQRLNPGKINMMNISLNPHSWRPSECCPFANLFADDLRILRVTFNKKLSCLTRPTFRA